MNFCYDEILLNNFVIKLNYIDKHQLIVIYDKKKKKKIFLLYIEILHDSLALRVFLKKI